MGKALVVDDSFIARKIISDMLITLEHEVAAELSNGEKIIETYENNYIDFILIDIEMPKVDGIVASKEILTKYSDAKIIMITSIVDKKRTSIALSYGVNSILLKPITIEELDYAISLLEK